MPDKTRKKTTTPKRTPKRDALVRKALALIERRLDKEDLNTSVADLIRLLELTEKQAGQRESEGTFVDPEDFNA